MTENTSAGPPPRDPYPGTPEGLPDLSPTPEDFLLVALGLKSWDESERARIAADPRLADYEKRMAQTAHEIFGARTGELPQPVLVGPWLLKAETSGKLAAKGGEDRFVNPMAKMVLRVFPKEADTQSRLYTIHFARGLPAGRIGLFSGDQRIPLQQEFDDDHYATVREADFAPVLQNGELTVRVE